MDTEDLVKNEKMLKGITYGFAVILLFLLGINIFLVVKKGFGATQIVPIALLPILILNLNNLREIKKELKSRKNQENGNSTESHEG